MYALILLETLHHSPLPRIPYKKLLACLKAKYMLNYWQKCFKGSELKTCFSLTNHVDYMYMYISNRHELWHKTGLANMMSIYDLFSNYYCGSVTKKMFTNIQSCCRLRSIIIILSYEM